VALHHCCVPAVDDFSLQSVGQVLVRVLADQGAAYQLAQRQLRFERMNQQSADDRFQGPTPIDARLEPSNRNRCSPPAVSRMARMSIGKQCSDVWPVNLYLFAHF
jgi:hypothetical protein